MSVYTNKTILWGWIILIRGEDVMNKYETSKIVGFCPARKWENKTWVFNINLKLWLNQYKLYWNQKICWNPIFCCCLNFSLFLSKFVFGTQQFFWTPTFFLRGQRNFLHPNFLDLTCCRLKTYCLLIFFSYLKFWAKNFWSKKFWGQKNSGLKKFDHKNVVYKN